MIAFSGLDGAGKSTQIELLKVFFLNSNKKTQVFWSRGGYTPGINFLKGWLRKSGADLIPKSAGPSSKRDEAFKHKSIKMIWLVLAVVDLIYFYAIVLRLKSLIGYKIICDRYIIDTEIDFVINFPDQNVQKWWLWKLLKILSPKPRYHFVLTVSVEESQRRSKLKNEPFPDTAEVLEYRLKKYLEYCGNNKHVHHIDCQRPVDVVSVEINTILGI